MQEQEFACENWSFENARDHKEWGYTTAYCLLPLPHHAVVGGETGLLRTLLLNAIAAAN